MTTIDMPIAAEAIAVERAETTDIYASLGAVLDGAIVTGWDSINVDIYHKDQPSRKIGGALLVTVQTLDEAGSHDRFIEIDEHHRPFPEDVITVLGGPAAEKARGPEDKAVFIRGEKRSQRLSRIICRDTCERQYIY